MNTNKDYEKSIIEIIKLVKKLNITTKNQLMKIKRKVMKKYKINKMISDSILYKKENIEIFKRKPSRKLSGVSVVAVMTKPHKCPHGKCVFCPGGTDFNTPQSYTGKEPAALRAERNNFQAYEQVKNRLEQYYILGQTPSKVELIIMGGTFTNLSLKYQEEFIKDCFKALNNLEKENKFSLKKLQKINETTLHRCVGLTIETRPDEIDEKTIKTMLRYGTTRVELGVQSVFDDVLLASNRGHTVKDSVKAIKLLKDNGFKINFHLMTNMPGSNLKKDLESFKLIFNDERFKPDMIKIYPCLLIKKTKLYKMFENKKWIPYSLDETIKLLSKIKTLVPNYVRIMRIQRDIPSFKIEQDLKNSNLRQIVQNNMKKNNLTCNCIRCREGGRNPGKIDESYIKLTKYKASKGTEYFFESIDKNNICFGFIRARIGDDNKNILWVRELHVYGTQVTIGNKGKIQHTGIGKRLIKKIEELAKKKRIKEIKIISGVGVREYYKRLGYTLNNFYMTKNI